MNSNDASFGNVHFRSVYENQHDQFNTGSKVQQNISKKQEAINSFFNGNPNRTKKIVPQILSLTNPDNNIQQKTNTARADITC